MVKRGIELRSHSNHTLFLLNYAAFLVQWEKQTTTKTAREQESFRNRVLVMTMYCG